MMAFTPPHSRWNDARHLPRSSNLSPLLRGSPTLRIPQDTRHLPLTPSTSSIHGSDWGSPFHLARKSRNSTSPGVFVPIKSSEDGDSVAFTPLRSGKPSPAASQRTVTTVDSRTSLPTLESPVHGYGSGREDPRTIYLPPRDISVRRTLENSFDAAIIVRDRKTPSPREHRKKTSSWGRDDDAVRRSRLKTEMCMHYQNGTACPFGENCTYAHGEEELQLTKLMDLHRAGLVDVDTYRTKPCLTWISTGSCPFGKRCSGIHDPRVAGTQHSWLPHTETQGNTIATDINVESLHQKRLNEILYNNPFGDSFSIETDTYDDLYQLVCNTKPSLGKKRRTVLAAHHKVDIALQMRGPPGWKYKFRPQHVIFDELCMVTQKRAFRLTDHEAVEIPLSKCRLSACDTPFQFVIVREIAFGPDSDSTVRGVALWFDVSDKDETVCTPQQAKRFRWKKPLRNRTNTPSPTMKKKSSPSTTFEHKDGFFMIRPFDTDAYNLVTEMLTHRLGVLRTQCVPQQMAERFRTRQALATQDAQLRTMLESQMRHWKTWAWPVNNGRETVDDSTPVPPVEGKYTPRIPGGGGKEGSSPTRANPVKHVWDSFLFMDVENPVGDKPIRRDGRLAAFEELSHGQTVSTKSHEILPHINHRYVQSGESTDTVNDSESERCWKALLLDSKHNFETNEWDAVREHFENSRSTKVLSILQQ